MSFFGNLFTFDVPFGRVDSWLGRDNERSSALETIFLIWYFCFRVSELSVCSFSLSEIVKLELVAVNFCLGGSIIPVALISLSLSELLLDVFWACEDCWRWFEIDSNERLILMLILMRDSKDGSEHMCRHVLPGPVIHFFLALWMVIFIFCWRLVCNMQSHW